MLRRIALNGLRYAAASEPRELFARCSKRSGALLTMELILVLPIVVALVMAIVEFSLLWTASQYVKSASQVACRVGTLPTSDAVSLDQAVRDAAAKALVKPRLVQTHQLVFEPGQHTGDPVTVELRVPMSSAAPDLLAIVGFGLEGRELVARTVMRKE